MKCIEKSNNWSVGDTAHISLNGSTIIGKINYIDGIWANVGPYRVHVVDLKTSYEEAEIDTVNYHIDLTKRIMIMQSKILKDKKLELNQAKKNLMISKLAGLQ
jgi:acetaldehyde dehydrogenase (acetylating)